MSALEYCANCITQKQSLRANPPVISLRHPPSNSIWQDMKVYLGLMLFYVEFTQALKTFCHCDIPLPKA